MKYQDNETRCETHIGYIHYIMLLRGGVCRRRGVRISGEQAAAGVVRAVAAEEYIKTII